MKTIYILGYNNLGADFWSDHINFNDNARVLFFNEGTSLLKHLKYKPDMIIVDDYFCERTPESHNFNDLKIGLSLLVPHKPVFFFSPSFTGKARKAMKFNHFYSCLDESILRHLNKMISKLDGQVLAA